MNAIDILILNSFFSAAFDLNVYYDIKTLAMYSYIWDSLYILYLSVCLFVCSYPINVKTAEPIGSKFCVVLHISPENVCRTAEPTFLTNIKCYAFCHFVGGM